MTDIYIKEGDIAKAIEFVVDDTTIDFTGASVVFNMQDAAGNQIISDGGASIETEIVDAVTYNFFRYAPLSEDVANSGQYRGEWRVTFGNGKDGRFPERGYIHILIGEHLDP